MKTLNNFQKSYNLEKNAKVTQFIAPNQKGTNGGKNKKASHPVLINYTSENSNFAAILLGNKYYWETAIKI